MSTSKYPWDQWLDGRVWLLREKLDFSCMIESMRSSVVAQAKKRDVAVATCIVIYKWHDSRTAAFGVLIQAYDYHHTWKPRLNVFSLDKLGKITQTATNRPPEGVWVS